MDGSTTCMWIDILIFITLILIIACLWRDYMLFVSWFNYLHSENANWKMGQSGWASDHSMATCQSWKVRKYLIISSTTTKWKKKTKLKVYSEPVVFCKNCKNVKCLRCLELNFQSFALTPIVSTDSIFINTQL